VGVDEFEMKVNSRSVKIMASRIEIDKPLQNGNSVVLRIEGDVVKEEIKDNFDGTVDVTYHVKGVLVEESDYQVLSWHPSGETIPKEEE
jgi:hypothetical protein